MKVASLYVISALVTGLHNFYWLMDIVNGAPINLLNCTALLGSATLFGSGIVVLSRRRVGAKIALTGSLLLWVYYAPMIFVSIFTPFTTKGEIQSLISFHEYVPLVGMLVGPMLLIACTVNVLLSFRREQKSGQSTL